MDFWTDIAFTILFRLIADKKQMAKYYPALAKLYVTLAALVALDPRFHAAVKEKEKPS